jgi:hypothetical protein
MKHDPNLPFGSTQKNISKSLVKDKIFIFVKCDQVIDTVLAPLAM